MGRNKTNTTGRQRETILARLRDELGDQFFCEFLIHALVENPAVSVGRYPVLAALWLRGRARDISQDATAERGEEPWSA